MLVELSNPARFQVIRKSGDIHIYLATEQHIEVKQCPCQPVVVHQTEGDKKIYIHISRE